MAKKSKKTTENSITTTTDDKVFTPLQQMFISLFNGNIKETALACNMSMSYASDLAEKTGVKEAIQLRHKKEYQPKIMSRQDRQAFWTRTIVDSSVEMRDRLKASELLGKSEMDFMDTPVRKDAVGMTLLDAALKSEAFKIAAIRLDAIIVKSEDISGIIPAIDVENTAKEIPDKVD